MKEIQQVTSNISKMEEIWKDIPGYEGLYAISDLGNVKTLRFDRNLKPNSQVRGYKTVTLVDYSRQKKQIRIHRLVCLSFLPNPENKKLVNHIDANTSNNRLDNLEWSTPLENSLHTIYLGNKPNQKTVLDTYTGVYYNCVRDAAKSANINYVTLLCRLNGNLKNHTKFISV